MCPAVNSVEECKIIVCDGEGGGNCPFCPSTPDMPAHGNRQATKFGDLSYFWFALRYSNWFIEVCETCLPLV